MTRRDAVVWSDSRLHPRLEPIQPASGWLAFNIKQDFLDDLEDDTGFAGLIRKLMRKRYIEVHAYRHYCHRLSIHGEPLHYVGMVARKLKAI